MFVLPDVLSLRLRTRIRVWDHPSSRDVPSSDVNPSAQAQREHIRKVEGVDLVSSALDW